MKPVRDASLVVIAPEDRYAVRQYFDFFESTRIQFRVLETQEGKSAPEHVLSRLNDYVEEYEIDEGDALWIVCDSDHWVEPNHIHNLTRVLQECRQKGIQVALSNPCFDLWLYLHFADFPTEQSLSCEEVGKRLRDAVGGFDKTRVYNLAIDEAKVSDALTPTLANPLAEGEIPTRPRTAVHLIIQALVAKRIISVRLVSKVADSKRKSSKEKK